MKKIALQHPGRWVAALLLFSLLVVAAASLLPMQEIDAAPPREIHRYYYPTADHPTSGWCDNCVGERITFCNGTFYVWGEETGYFDAHYEPCF